MEADLLTSLLRDLVVEAQAVPVHPLHVGAGVVGGDQPSGVPRAPCHQWRNKKTENQSSLLFIFPIYISVAEN